MQSLVGHYIRIPQFPSQIHAKKDGRGDCGRGGPHQVLMYHQSEYFHQFYKIIELVDRVARFFFGGEAR